MVITIDGKNDSPWQFITAKGYPYKLPSYLHILDLLPLY